jgi:peroxiredoxin
MKLCVALAAPLAALLVACASARGESQLPTWDRPGLGGAVRPEMGSPQPGEAAPPLALPDLAGNTVSLASMRGSWVLLHFTATWCPFCDSELAHLGTVARALAARSVKTMVVDLEEDAGVWSAYAAKHVDPAIIALYDATGASAARFAPPGAQPSFDDRAQAVLDATLIVDPAGAIRLFLLPDSAHFDPTFRAVRAELETLVPTPTVAVSASPCAAKPGGHTEAHVLLIVAAGFHLMSNRPSEPTYIPTRVTLEANAGALTGETQYPPPTLFRIGDRSISTFAGTIDLRIPIDVAEDAPVGSRRIRGVLRYQACTASRCLFPTSQPFEVELVVAPLTPGA